MPARFDMEKEGAALVAGWLGRLPTRWREVARAEYEDKSRHSAAAGWGWLRELVEPLEGAVDIAASDDDIVALSREVAGSVREELSDAAELGAEKQLMRAFRWCAVYGVRWPEEFDRAGIVARVTDSVWWLRGLRRSHARAREAAARGAGLVHRGGDIYASDDTVDRRRAQKRRNAALLAGVELVSEDSGQIMALDKIAAAGVANPDNRRAELVTRARGLEECAIEQGHAGVFVTLTCPSRMHAMTAGGRRNKKYDGTEPDKAQRYLVGSWARARAELARRGVVVYGLRVAEPHHDGTPHWHMMLFAAGCDVSALVAVLETYFCEDSAEEIKRDKSPRVKVVQIDPSKGTAAGYIAKYIAKNIGGIDGEHDDEGGGSSAEAAERVEAWASTWGIRQFQQIGGHQVSVWRELRRVEACAAEAAGGDILRAWMPAQKRGAVLASYADFIRALGGVMVSQREGRVCLAVDYEEARARYGCVVARRVRGVAERYGSAYAASNRERWHRL